MNNKTAIEMQNALGRFIQLYHLNGLESADVLFSKEACLWLPDRMIKAQGIETIRTVLKKVQEDRIAKGVHRDVHIPHTPGYDTIENDTIGVATWDLHSYDITVAEDGKDQIEYIYSRIDAKYVQEDGVWKFLELDWWDVESFTPWDYVPEEDDSWQIGIPTGLMPPAFIGDTSVRDFYAIQNVMSRFSHNNRKYAMEDTFANREDITYRSMPLCPNTARGTAAVEAELKKLETMEEENIGMYVFVPATGAPVIEVAEDGQSANAQWMVSCCTFEGEAFGIQGLPNKYVRRIGLLSATLIKEDSEWRVKDYDVNQFLTVPKINFDSYCQLENTDDFIRYQRMGMNENRWKPAPPKMGGDYPEDIPYLETFLARWISAYRRGEYETFFKKYSLNDEHESTFHSHGRGRCTPAVVGTDYLHKFFTMGWFCYHHQQITNHCGMSPDIEVSADGRYAMLAFFDINTTAIIPGKPNSPTIDVPKDWNQDNSGYEHTPCRHHFSVYHLDAAKVNGEWKLIHVDWETLVSFPFIHLAGKSSRGWAGSVSSVKYPALFEKYQYSHVRKLKK